MPQIGPAIFLWGMPLGRDGRGCRERGLLFGLAHRGSSVILLNPQRQKGK